MGRRRLQGAHHGLPYGLAGDVGAQDLLHLYLLVLVLLVVLEAASTSRWGQLEMRNLHFNISIFHTNR